MLTLLWEWPVFRRYKSVKWAVTPVFITAGGFLIQECTRFIAVSSEFLSAKRAINDRSPGGYREICEESTLIARLVAFVQETILLLRLIAAISREKRAITETLNAIGRGPRERLGVAAFGAPDGQSIFESIREFARLLVHSHPELRSDIEAVYERQLTQQ
jgi:hypothetical protein